MWCIGAVRYREYAGASLYVISVCEPISSVRLSFDEFRWHMVLFNLYRRAWPPEPLEQEVNLRVTGICTASCPLISHWELVAVLPQLQVEHHFLVLP